MFVHLFACLSFLASSLVYLLPCVRQSRGPQRVRQSRCHKVVVLAPLRCAETPHCEQSELLIPSPFARVDGGEFLHISA